jgi:EAL domain-containing protein (putative c-di-GMP-specific phosphodiesterase class I)
VLPVLESGAGQLYLALPVAFTVRKTRDLLQTMGWTFREQGGIVTIDVPQGDLAAYCAQLDASYTPVELAAIRAVFVPGNRSPKLSDLFEADSLARVNARSRAGQLAETLGVHLTTVFQPIVDAQTLDVFGYEALLRTTPGAPLDGVDEIFRVARAADLLPQTDLSARKSAIACAGGIGSSAHLFINFMPSSIYDPKSCLRSTIAALDEAGIDHERVIFEVVESDEVEDPSYLIDILRAYRNAGFKVALDDLGSGFASLNLLHVLRPDFVKLDIALVRDIDSDPFKAMLGSKLIEASHALGMTVVAEGIETAEEFAWLRESGAHLLQGFYLARPAPVPAARIQLPGRV